MTMLQYLCIGYRKPAHKATAMIDRSLLFRTAWRNARNAAAAHGIALRAAFRDALRRAWAAMKAMARPAVSLAAETAAMIASIRAGKEAGERFVSSKPWRFANSSTVAW